MITEKQFQEAQQLIKDYKKQLIDEARKEYDKKYKVGTYACADTKIIDSNMSVRTINCLKAAEIEVLGDLKFISKNKLLRLRCFGKASLKEVEDCLLQIGLVLSP